MERSSPETTSPRLSGMYSNWSSTEAEWMVRPQAYWGSERQSSIHEAS